MPKILENLKTTLTEKAGEIIEAEGYSALTIRSVAKACGVGVGTVYNYFPSKEALLAAYLLGDWEKCIERINAEGVGAASAEPVLRCIFDQLTTYAEQYAAVFHDRAARDGFAGSFGAYHALLRAQLAAPIRRFVPDDFTADFIAESLLVWSMNGKTFEEIYGVIGKLF